MRYLCTSFTKKQVLRQKRRDNAGKIKDKRKTVSNIFRERKIRVNYYRKGQ